jgi:hypothetical protein
MLAQLMRDRDQPGHDRHGGEPIPRAEQQVVRRGQGFCGRRVLVCSGGFVAEGRQDGGALLRRGIGGQVPLPPPV